MKNRYYTIYKVEYVAQLFNDFGGYHIDGERGHQTYPATNFTKEQAIEAYKKGE